MSLCFLFRRCRYPSRRSFFRILRRLSFRGLVGWGSIAENKWILRSPFLVIVITWGIWGVDPPFLIAIWTTPSIRLPKSTRRNYVSYPGYSSIHPSAAWNYRRRWYCPHGRPAAGCRFGLSGSEPIPHKMRWPWIISSPLLRRPI